MELQSFYQESLSLLPNACISFTVLSSVYSGPAFENTRPSEGPTDLWCIVTLKGSREGPFKVVVTPKNVRLSLIVNIELLDNDYEI
mmetsp:Transcript_17906/g.32256  ORF Transcript_17906/g.32256 Transcript_17906/m.32256 type:complete len:86 (-) Transcript_17906:47-304(-)